MFASLLVAWSLFVLLRSSENGMFGVGTFAVGDDRVQAWMKINHAERSRREVRRTLFFVGLAAEFTFINFER